MAERTQPLTEVIDPPPDRYGIVTVRLPNGDIDREFRITGAELAELHRKGGPPAGVTVEEWTSGRARVVGKDREQGEYHIRKNKVLVLTSRAAIRNGRWIETTAEFLPGEWTDHGDGTISIGGPVLTDLNRRSVDQKRTNARFVALTRNTLVVDEP